MENKSMKTATIWHFIKKNIISLSTVITGVIILILRSLGLFDFTLQSGLSLILGLLVMLATSEMVDKSKKLDQIEDLISEGFSSTIKSVGGIEIKKFTVISGGFDYLAERLKNTKHEIDHAAFAPPIPRWPKQAEKYTTSLAKVLKENTVRFRYIADLSPKLGKSRLENIANRLRDSKIKQFYSAYFEQAGNSIPQVSFMIFDQEEILLYYPPIIGEVETALAIKHPEIVRVYAKYFNKLWSDATKIENLDAVEQLLSSFK